MLKNTCGQPILKNGVYIKERNSSKNCSVVREKIYILLKMGVLHPIETNSQFSRYTVSSILSIWLIISEKKATIQLPNRACGRFDHSIN